MTKFIRYILTASLSSSLLISSCTLTNKNNPFPSNNTQKNIVESKTIQPQEPKLPVELTTTDNKKTLNKNQENNLVRSTQENSTIYNDNKKQSQTLNPRTSFEDKNNNETDYYANSIEEALEFCEASQKYRENNDPDNALKALDQAYRIITDIPGNENLANQQQLDDLRFTIAKRILEVYSTRTNGTKGTADEIPMTMNLHVEKEIKRLTGRERRFFIYSYKRSGKFMPMILKKLKDADLPEELAWLPLIESGFKVKALSKARALGLWQFIPSTGYKFGLKRNLYIDERLDPEKATDAAIAYFKELHNIFGDWSTVLAAYNCGEGRVLRTIKRQNLKYLDNFWDLYHKLPYETARYVPRFIATLHIVKNLEKYEFKELKPYKQDQYDKVFINRSIHLKDIAKVTGSKLQELKDLNPALRYNIVPPDGYNVRTPVGKGEILKAGIDKIPSRKLQKSYAMHKVRRGETLSGIAKKYKTSVRSVMLTNRLSRKNYIVPGQLLKIPSKSYLASRVERPVISKSKSGALYYSVRRGDSLWSVAKRFNTSSARIRQLNNLHSDMLSIGQKLKVKVNTKTSGFATYKVKPGDSPFKIASKHNMSLNRFLNINDMHSGSRIFPGQKVFVE